jgi:hypothetical protein
MVKKLLGYLFAAIGFVGFGFFRNYDGSLISLSALGFYVSMGIGVIGVYLITTSKSAEDSRQEKFNLYE